MPLSTPCFFLTCTNLLSFTQWHNGVTVPGLKGASVALEALISCHCFQGLCRRIPWNTYCSKQEPVLSALRDGFLKRRLFRNAWSYHITFCNELHWLCERPRYYSLDIERQLNDKAIIRHSQHGFIKGKSCPSNLISFCDKVTHLVDERMAVDVIFLHFSKAFGTAPHSILLDKLSNCEISRFMLFWVMNWLDGRAQRIVVNRATSDW